jgi:hypothetical protein
VSVPKPNYQHARRERERIRKARKQEKLQRRTEREPTTTTAAGPEVSAAEPIGADAALPQSKDFE